MKSVITIGFGVCVLFAAIVVFAGGAFNRGRVGISASITVADSDLNSFQSAFEQYQKIAGHYPSEEQGLFALIEEPKTDPIPKRWAQSYDDEESFLDPWDTPYRYHYPGIQNPKRPEIISAGPDTEFGTDDDQSNQD
ncbi:type II secretion system protein GspG [bacterium]|nr:type II secretion system protein GspG [bacterium]